MKRPDISRGFGQGNLAEVATRPAATFELVYGCLFPDQKLKGIDRYLLKQNPAYEACQVNTLKRKIFFDFFFDFLTQTLF